MMIVVLATGVTSSPGVARGSAMPMPSATSGINMAGVANELASRKFRATRPTISTRAEKKTRAGTAARYDSASAVGGMLKLAASSGLTIVNDRSSTSDM